jgi:glycosyltransferase involved in cell wall biosynthesis
MRVLYVAPMPPPITGHSIASKVFFNHLRRSHFILPINLSDGSLHDGTVTFKRVLAVLKACFAIIRSAKTVDVIYLTISESVSGNIKDLVFLSLANILSLNCVIHLHGGSFKENILNRFWFLRVANRFFLNRVDSAIISGPSHANIFNGVVPASRLYIVQNFAQDFIFAETEKIKNKFLKTANDEVRILYMGGMTRGKGYQILLEAYERLIPSVRPRFRLDFAGKFESPAEERQFVARISPYPQIFYHGVVSDSEKASLFAGAHIFCLPTEYLEGQPISILEAYAAGCAVVTTDPPGVRDIFTAEVNGFSFSAGDSLGLKHILEGHGLCLDRLQEIAMRNRGLAEERFRETRFCQSLESILMRVGRE